MPEPGSRSASKIRTFKQRRIRKQINTESIATNSIIFSTSDLNKPPAFETNPVSFFGVSEVFTSFIGLPRCQLLDIPEPPGFVTQLSNEHGLSRAGLVYLKLLHCVVKVGKEYC